MLKPRQAGGNVRRSNSTSAGGESQSIGKRRDEDKRQTLMIEWYDEQKYETDGGVRLRESSTALGILMECSNIDQLPRLTEKMPWHSKKTQSYYPPFLKSSLLHFGDE